MALDYEYEKEIYFISDFADRVNYLRILDSRRRRETFQLKAL